MVTEKYPPEGSNISMKFTPGGVTYTWPAEPRGSLGIESMGAVIYLVGIMAFMGFVFFILFPSDILKSFDKGIDFGLLFVGFLLLALFSAILKNGRTIYLVLRTPPPAGLELTPGEIIYRTGAKRLKLKIGGRGRIDPDDGVPERLKNKTYVLPLKDRENFVLERVGDYLLLSFKHGDETVEVGSSLKESDKEWLYSSLREFK